MVSIAAALLLVASNAQGDTPAERTCSLTVRVNDSSRSRIPHATVEINREDGARANVADARGEVVFPDVLCGNHRVCASAPGFTRECKDVSIGAKAKVFELVLNVARRDEEVIVTREQDLRDVFVRVLTSAQIAQLPDDPEEMRALLEEMAGPGAVIRVDGFGGGRLPHKSLIQSIRFDVNAFSAEFHSPGGLGIDIRTKPGLGRWGGTTSIGGKHHGLNANPAFGEAEDRAYRANAAVVGQGPLVKGRSSLALDTSAETQATDQVTRIAQPDGTDSDVVRPSTERAAISLRFSQLVRQDAIVRLAYLAELTDGRNQGVGELDLAERSYARKAASHVFRASHEGPLGRGANELKLEARLRSSEIVPRSDAPTVDVLGAFRAGGAGFSSDRRTLAIELSDDFDLTWKKRHAIRLGMTFAAERIESVESRNRAGTYVFGGVDAFREARPIAFTQQTGDPRVDFTYVRLGAYVQDDLRIGKRGPVLGFGIRQEIQTAARKLNLAPRLSLSWSPPFDRKSAIRAGAGIFYDWFDANLSEQAQRLDGVRQQELLWHEPPYPVVAPFAAERVLVGRIELAPDIRLPRLGRLAVQFSRPVGKNGGRMDLHYWIQRGDWHPRSRNINAPFTDGVRPLEAVGNLSRIESAAKSFEEVVQCSLSQAPVRSLHLFLRYRYGRELNETDSPLGLPGSNWTVSERGPSRADRRHSLVTTARWEAAKQIALRLTLIANGATPYTVLLPLDRNKDGLLNDRPEGVGRNAMRGESHWTVNAHVIWRKGFGTPARGRDDPVLQLVDVGDGRELFATNDHRFEFAAHLSAVNLMNHTNPIGYVGTLGSPLFGRPTGALTSRTIQLGASLSF
jgi:hypothetical protein